MSPALLQLEERILGMLLAQKGKPISLREIEETLASGGNRVDTFEVRDAVWRLIDKRKADFTPLRDVMAVGA